MSLQLRQNLKLAQQLVMTPQLQQAIKLLQLSRLELVETVEQALMENPLLEERQHQEEPGGEGDGERENPGKDEVQKIEGEEHDLLRNAEWEDYLGVFSSTSRSSSEREIPEEMVSLETVCSSKPSLESHLSWQLHLSNLSRKEVEIGEVVINNLDSSGYLALDTEEVVQLTGYSEPDVEEALAKVRQFDPVGVGSRSLQECLLEQVHYLDHEDPKLIEIIQNHLNDLENRNYKALSSKLDLSLEQVKEYIDIIQGLDPRPGSSFRGGDTFYVSPDAYVYKYDEEFVILLNDDGLPDLSLSPYYLESLSRQSKKESDYLQEKMREALWLIKSIQQRQRTLYRVVESIVKFQREFFERGVNHLRPLVLKDVAEDIEVHESTVSRITTNKFVSTPFGIYELKFFFSSGLGKDGGGQMASESVKNIIKKLISEENPQKPLSDKGIVELLNEKLQVNIARRTVAKYREAMNIPSSTKRKKLF